MRSYGDSSFTVISSGGHANRITGVRVLRDGNTTYGNKKLQIYATVYSNYHVRVTQLGDTPNYGVHSAVTPVVQNSISGYSEQGRVDELNAYTLATDQGIRAGGLLYGKSGLVINGTSVINSSGQWTGSSSGLIGPQGSKGQKGQTGAQGPKGQKGERGPQGAKGQKGERGPTGPTGAGGGGGTAGGVGSFVFAVEQGSNKSAKNLGSTLAGSSLRPAFIGGTGPNTVNTSYVYSAAYYLPGTDDNSVLSGSWRLMGAYADGSVYNDYPVSLWYRYA
jgi:hypothetical protein